MVVYIRFPFESVKLFLKESKKHTRVGRGILEREKGAFHRT